MSLIIKKIHHPYKRILFIDKRKARLPFIDLRDSNLPLIGLF